jgi:hypothetical protein
MKAARRIRLAGLILGVCLGSTSGAGSGPYVNLMQPCDCPPNHYSALHVLVPSFYRWAAWCQGPCRYTFVKDRYCIPPTHNINPYHCPAANPMQFSLNHYIGLSGDTPRSTFQAPEQPRKKQEQQAKQEQPQGPQLLPPPRPEPEKK